MGALAGLSGTQRSVLNLLLKGGCVVNEAGTARYQDEHGTVRRTLRWHIVDRLRHRGLIASDGTITDAGRELVTRRASAEQAAGGEAGT